MRSIATILGAALIASAIILASAIASGRHVRARIAWDQAGGEADAWIGR